jgi:hypothetical protein
MHRLLHQPQRLFISFNFPDKKRLFPRTTLTNQSFNGEVFCLLCGRNWVCKYYLGEIRPQRVKYGIFHVFRCQDFFRKLDFISEGCKVSSVCDTLKCSPGIQRVSLQMVLQWNKWYNTSLKYVFVFYGKASILILFFKLLWEQNKLCY